MSRVIGLNVWKLLLCIVLDLNYGMGKVQNEYKNDINASKTLKLQKIIMKN